MDARLVVGACVDGLHLFRSKCSGVGGDYESQARIRCLDRSVPLSWR